MIGIFSILAEFERDLTAQRTAEMMEAFRAKNIKLGRKEAIKSKENGLKKTYEMYLKRDRTGLSVEDICLANKVSKTAFYKYLPTLKDMYK